MSISVPPSGANAGHCQDIQDSAHHKKGALFIANRDLLVLGGFQSIQCGGEGTLVSLGWGGTATARGVISRRSAKEKVF